jgi:hypothetical protein
MLPILAPSGRLTSFVSFGRGFSSCGNRATRSSLAPLSLNHASRQSGACWLNSKNFTLTELSTVLATSRTSCHPLLRMTIAPSLRLSAAKASLESKTGLKPGSPTSVKVDNGLPLPRLPPLAESLITFLSSVPYVSLVPRDVLYPVMNASSHYRGSNLYSPRGRG